MNIPRLVAHRGDARAFPENTLPAIEAALRAGAPFVEFDVQLSADAVPVVIHDATLERTTNGRGAVFEHRAPALARLNAGEPARFGARFRDTALPTLAATVALLGDWPRVGVFVELKRASLQHFGVDEMLARVASVIAPIAQRCVIISFDAPAVAAAHAAGLACGWVFEGWTDAARRQAEQLAPAYLFTDYERVPLASGMDTGPLWPGPWQWVLYDIVDPELAVRWARRGAGFIETSAIAEMLAHPLLAPGRRREASL